MLVLIDSQQARRQQLHLLLTTTGGFDVLSFANMTQFDHRARMSTPRAFILPFSHHFLQLPAPILLYATPPALADNQWQYSQQLPLSGLTERLRQLLNGD